MLEAPTRHPVDWKNPEFYDAASADRELERVFDLCHPTNYPTHVAIAADTLASLAGDLS